MSSTVLEWLASADGLALLGACLPGQPEILAIELVAASLTATASFALLSMLLVFSARRRDLAVPKFHVLAVSLFVLNGVTPLVAIASIWLPVAGFAALLQLAAGIAWALTVVALWRLLPLGFTLPKRADLQAAKARLEAEISERIAAQSALTSLNAELEARVAERTAALTRSNAELLAEIAEKQELTTELAQARDQAEGANRVKSMFLAAMSHDLRTPLNAIIGFSEMMLQAVRGPIGQPKYHAYVEDIHRSGYLLLSLINNILDLSKIEAGKHELAPALVDGRQIAEECIALIAGQTGFAEIAPLITVQGDGRLYADELALRQIVMNLVGNAAKFTPSGGQIAVGLGRSPDGGSTLAVTDTGIGMDEKGIRKALEPFGQATLTARPRGSGSGLGLTIVTKLVEAHGGRFAIDSAPSYGTTVRIWLPGPPAGHEPELALRHQSELPLERDGVGTTPESRSDHMI